jgi:hypothetical protein
MFKNTVCLSMLVTATCVAYANGTAQLTAEEIAQRSVQELQSLQSELKAAIDSEVGQAKCSGDQQCRTLAIGANPCGGPESYLAYSTLNTDVEQLKNLAEQYRITRKTLHVKTGTMGACIVIPEPEVQCKNQQCVSKQKPNVLVF